MKKIIININNQDREIEIFQIKRKVEREYRDKYLQMTKRDIIKQQLKNKDNIDIEKTDAYLNILSEIETIQDELIIQNTTGLTQEELKDDISSKDRKKILEELISQMDFRVGLKN